MVVTVSGWLFGLTMTEAYRGSLLYNRAGNEMEQMVTANRSITILRVGIKSTKGVIGCMKDRE